MANEEIKRKILTGLLSPDFNLRSKSVGALKNLNSFDGLLMIQEILKSNIGLFMKLEALRVQSEMNIDENINIFIDNLKIALLSRDNEVIRNALLIIYNMPSKKELLSIIPILFDKLENIDTDIQYHTLRCLYNLQDLISISVLNSKITPLVNSENKVVSDCASQILLKAKNDLND